MIQCTKCENELAGDYVYRVLQENIVQVNLIPGELLSANDVSAALNVSRTPVQSAFAKLGAEGLLCIQPQKSSCVSRIDLDRVYESIYMRNIYDQIAARYICENKISSEKFSELEKNYVTHGECLNQGRMDEIMRLDNRFHDIIYELCDMSHARAALKSISFDQDRIRYLKFNSKIELNRTLKTHEEIIAAFKKKDSDRACLLSHEHVSCFWEDIDVLYQQHPDYFSGWAKRRFKGQKSKLEVYYNFKKQT